MASVTFPVEFGGSGITITDDADPTTGLDGTGYIERFVPALQQGLAMTGHAVQKASEANQSATTASQAAQQASDDRDSINLDLQTLNGLVSEADASADAAAGSAITASNMADAVAEATATYTSVSAGLAATVDTNYFRVIEAPEASRVSVYRNDAGSAALITTYYTKTGVDAKQAAAVRLNRSLQRFGDNGQTLHSDFNLDAYGLGSQLFGGVQEAHDAEELWDVERLSGTYALQHTGDGSLKYVEVPPNTLAREWNPETGDYAAQISGAVTNEFRSSGALSSSSWIKHNGITVDLSAESIIEGKFAEKITPAIGQSNSRVYQTCVITGRCVMWALFKPAGYGSFRLEPSVTGGFPAAVVYNSETDAFDLAESGAINYGRKILPGGWYLVYVEFDRPSDTSGIFFMYSLPSGQTSGGYSGYDGVSGAYIAHAQLEQGTRHTSPIITTDAPVTRAADNVKRVLGAEFNPDSFTIFCSASKIENTTALPVMVGLQASVGLDRLTLFTSPSGENWQFLINVGGVNLIQSPNLKAVTGEVKVALSVAQTQVQIHMDGESVYVGNIPVNSLNSLTELFIGGRRGAARFPASFSEVRMISGELSNEQLQELTQ